MLTLSKNICKYSHTQKIDNHFWLVLGKYRFEIDLIDLTQKRFKLIW